MKSIFLHVIILGCFLQNYHYNGHNLKELSGPNGPTGGKELNSAAECQQYCQTYKECEAFSYFTESKKCYIKSERGTRTASSAISGPKYCDGKNTYS